MVIKRSELEQKVKEHNERAFEGSLVALETQIDVYLISFADRIRWDGAISYYVRTKQVMRRETRGGEYFTNSVILEAVRKYEAEGWKVSKSKDNLNRTVLKFS